MDFTKLTENLSKASLAAVLVAEMWAGMQGYWVFGSTYKDMVAQRDLAATQRDQWEQTAVKALTAGEAHQSRITGVPNYAETHPSIETAKQRVAALEAALKGF